MQVKVEIMTDLSVIAADAEKAVAALPIVTNAIAKMQSDLTDKQHASVVNVAADALNLAAQSAQALGAKGLIGHNDASNMETGAEVIASGVGIVSEIEALAVRLKALVEDIF